MLPLLTKYLLQYGQVCIPHIGTFEIIQEPPQLDVADKRVNPPSYSTRLSRQEAVTEHQFSYLAAADRGYHPRSELLHFGERLRETLRRKPVKWNGFGTLRFAANEIVFEPESIQVESLSFVPARKVMRENVQHQVLVGDREMSREQVTHVLQKGTARKPVVFIIGWILLALAVITIVVLLVTGGFRTSSSGLRTSASAFGL